MTSSRHFTISWTSVVFPAYSDPTIISLNVVLLLDLFVFLEHLGGNRPGLRSFRYVWKRETVFGDPVVQPELLALRAVEHASLPVVLCYPLHARDHLAAKRAVKSVRRPPLNLELFPLAHYCLPTTP